MPTLDVAPGSAGRPLIEAYPPGGFRIGGVDYQGPVLVSAEGTLPWPVASAHVGSGAVLEPDDFEAVLRLSPAVEVLVVGTGPRMTLLSGAVRAALRAAGIGVDVMATGAACRTYNVLVSETRRVAAALLPMPDTGR